MPLFHKASQSCVFMHVFLIHVFTTITCIFFKNMFSSILEKEQGRGGERNSNQLPPSGTLSGNRACNQGIFPYLELNQQPLSALDNAQPTGPHSQC